LEAVLADIATRGISRVYCLGDLVGYGPDPNGAIDLLRERRIPSLLGNYDEGIGWDTGDCGCFYPDEQAKEIGKISYEFTSATVTPDRKAYLRNLPRELHLELADKRVRLVHGSPRRINEYLLKDRNVRTYLRLARDETDDILAFGHTHDPWYRQFGDKLFVNVGSVGRPKDGDPHAMYVILASSPDVATGSAAREAGAAVEVETRRVEYDVEAVAQAIITVGLPAALADLLRTGG
jgi:predicted phosphodiesterase